MRVTAGIAARNGARKSVKGLSHNISVVTDKTSRVSFQ
jgi:hypothetical protein